MCFPFPGRTACHRRRQPSPPPEFPYVPSNSLFDMLAAAATYFPRPGTLSFYIVWFFLLAASFYSLLLLASSDRVVLSLPRFPSVILPAPIDNRSNVSERYTLENVLKDAAMEDGTVILTTLNAAWSAPGSVIDLFLESFRIGDDTYWLLNHLVVIALDTKAFSRCVAVHSHCFALVTEGVDFSSEAYFMTPDYLKMMWRRIDFLRSVLEMGYTFVFTDADVMWFRNPFSRFFSDADLQIACDHYTGNSEDISNKPNGGFNYVQSNNRSIEFYKFWYSSRIVYPRNHDQDVFNFIKSDRFITEIGLKIRFLNTAYFGGFCEPSKDLNEVCTMHANCCFGLESKLHDLRIMLQDWKRYLSVPPALKRSVILSWNVPQNCSLASLHVYNAPANITE